MNKLDQELQKIRRRIIDSEVSYVEIARRAGISWKTVSRIAAGIETNPRLKTAQMISDAIDVRKRKADPQA